MSWSSEALLESPFSCWTSSNNADLCDLRAVTPLIWLFVFTNQPIILSYVQRNLWFSLYRTPPWSGSARCQHANRVTGSTLRVRRSKETVALQVASESSRTVFLRLAEDGLVCFRCCLNPSTHLSFFCCCLSLSHVDNKENEVGKSLSSEASLLQ